MARKVCNYFILSNICLLLMAVQPALGQEKAKAKPEEKPNIPLYNGLSVGVDLVGVGSSVMGSDFLSGEVSVEANLLNRFFPIVEMGLGTTDTESDTGTRYKTTAPYFRLGLNYNTMYKKNNKGYLYVGLRYAFSTFSYDVKGSGLDDPIWGGSVGNLNLRDEIWGTYAPAFNHQDMKGSMHWAEIVLGVNVHIYKQLSMGWAVRMKYRINASTSEHGDPWYVPGFGKYDSSTTGITYTIVYKLPSF